MHQVMIHPATYENCKEAVDRAFTLFPQQINGKKVLIKPNVLRSSLAEDHIVTHPAILRAVVEKVEELNPAEIVVGDNPGLHSYGDNALSFEKTGLLEAAKGYYRNLGDASRQVKFNPEYKDQVSVSSEILDADVLISLPKFKTHGLTVMTGAIKNSYGILPGAQKALLHQLAGSPDRFQDMMIDVFQLRIPDLFIMDAVVGMEGNGPASPDLREIGVVLAADNGVALDGVVARMMGIEPSCLRFMVKAAERGLGEYSIEALHVDGELTVIKDFKIPPLASEGIATNASLAEMMHVKARLRPSADPELCTGCGNCVDQCPVSALKMQTDLPEVDDEKCITCFCCQEICPEKAIRLQ
jgi:uncharacterized protein (DUF362 family)/NAD-dependent dihydropyrimidine dehydrogenase PreA subunit